MRSALYAACLVSLASGCARSAAPPEAPTHEETHAPSASEAYLTRAEVNATVDAGLGRVLARMGTEPSMVDGAFQGFRLTHIAFEGRNAQLLDLRPGDVIQSLNGRSIDRPERALEAFEALREAPAIVVSFLRDGERRELRVPIVD